MAQILTCIEGVGDNGICPAGMIPELVEGYIFTADPTAFDPSIAAQYFSFSFGTVLGLFCARPRRRFCFWICLGSNNGISYITIRRKFNFIT